jgi:hypothetical protein
LQNGPQDYLVKGQGGGNLVSCAIRFAIERKRAEERLAYMSQYDHLIGLVKRILFQKRLRRALVRADRDGMLVTLLLVDLDRFKADPLELLLPGVGRETRLPVFPGGGTIWRPRGVVFGGILSGELCRCA